MIYVDFERILVPENKNNKIKMSYTNKHQKHVACSYGYKLVCVDNKFNKLFTFFLGEDAVYSFINNMIEKSKSRYCADFMEKHFNMWKILWKNF